MDWPKTKEEQTEWQRKVLYHQRTRTDFSNERKYLGWLRVSLGMITLGFVVERLDLFLARSQEMGTQAVSGILVWAPLIIYLTGSVTICVATWEFFRDRSRIAAEEGRKSWLLFALIFLVLVFVLLIALLLWLPGVQGAR